ncbi:MAG: TrmB family transcriptional regulator [Anaerolineales bacterium]|nr:TrmB family transcriptional regulator [Anaerolineales bacterium]
MDARLTLERLTAVGFSRYEAAAYLGLLGYAESTAMEVAERAQVPRQRIYDVLESLRAKGLITVRMGRPTRHSACAPAVALPGLLAARQRQQTAENNQWALLIQELIADLDWSPAHNGAAGASAPSPRATERLGGL